MHPREGPASELSVPTGRDNEETPTTLAWSDCRACGRHGRGPVGGAWQLIYTSTRKVMREVRITLGPRNYSPLDIARGLVLQQEGSIHSFHVPSSSAKLSIVRWNSHAEKYKTGAQLGDLAQSHPVSPTPEIDAFVFRTHFCPSNDYYLPENASLMPSV